MWRPAGCCDGKGAAGFAHVMRRSGRINTRGAETREARVRGKAKGRAGKGERGQAHYRKAGPPKEPGAVGSLRLVLDRLYR